MATTLDRTAADPAAAHPRAIEIAAAIWDRLGRRQPSVLERLWWEENLIDWALSDEAIRIQMLRFVAVLPTLADHRQVARHLAESFELIRERDPAAARLGLPVDEDSGLLGRAVAYNARRNVTRMAGRFLIGPTAEAALPALDRLRDQGLAVAVRPVARQTLSEADADSYAALLVQTLNSIGPRVESWPDDAILDRSSHTPLPRLSLVVQISRLASNCDPVRTKAVSAAIGQRLAVIAAAARAVDAHLHIAGERPELRPLADDIAHSLAARNDDWPHLSIEVDAADPSAAERIDRWRQRAADNSQSFAIVLTDSPTQASDAAIARLRSRSDRVLSQEAADSRFVTLAERLLADRQTLRPTIATHDLAHIAVAIAAAEDAGCLDHDWELQTPLGFADDLARTLADLGHRVRLACPLAEAMPGMADLARTLLQAATASRPAFGAADRGLPLRYDRDRDAKDLLMPASAEVSAPLAANPGVARQPEPPRFENEPLVDWSDQTNREAMDEAIDLVQSELGGEYPLVIDGKAMDGRGQIVSRNPSKKTEVVGKTSAASPDQAREAVEAADRAFETWGRRTADERAEYLEVIAAELRNRRLELAAWLCFEAGKTWAEADLEVAEAIDFCRFYASEARRMEAVDAVHLVGEENETEFRPRGVCVAISPWNSPLAILTGMAAAALATGNTVVMKPAEQTPIVAAKLLDIMRDSGLPSGVANYVPGAGDEIGPILVSHPQTAVVAFTGSSAVGKKVAEAAAAAESQQAGLTRVVAEMGGHNAIIVDEDADLDQAVAGVIESAFAHAGQSCDRCSRVIVLKGVREAFVNRLVDAIGSRETGPATDAATLLGPLIDEESYDRIVKAIADADEELEFAVSSKPSKKTGYFIGPHVAVDVPPEHFLTQEELLGPLLAVQVARSFDEAITLANATPYALVAGCYSRSPKHLKVARRELTAGNIYLNRPTVGSLVARQPFGGYALSGIGTKAGGSDYLRQFVIPVTVSESTLERGFLPTGQ